MKPKHAELTTRELQVLALIANEGLKNTAIAERLSISASTAKHHVAAIIDKLKVENRSQAAIRFREWQRPTQLSVSPRQMSVSRAQFPDLPTAPITDWRFWLETGRSHSQAVRHDKARDAYLTGLLFTASTPTAKALISSELAYSSRALDEFTQARQYTDEALAALQVASPYSDAVYLDYTESPSQEQLERAFAGQSAGLEAYARLAMVRAQIHEARREFQAEDVAITAQLNAAAVLEDKHMQAEALHFKGRMFRELGTGVEGLAWRTVKSYDELRSCELAIKYFQMARKCRSRDDWAGLAHDWRNEAQIRHILGETDLALEAERQAERLFKANRSPAISSLYLDQGRRLSDLALDEPDTHANRRLQSRAEDLLRADLALAWEIESPDMASKALAFLGGLHVADKSSQQQLLALLLCAGSLIMWAHPFHHPDFQRTNRLFQSLMAGLVGANIVRADTTLADLLRQFENEFPFSIISRFRNYNTEHIFEVSRYLQDMTNYAAFGSTETHHEQRLPVGPEQQSA